MPGLYRDEGVVLKTIKLGEADRILTIFTRGEGKVRAVAKGIRKTKSRFGGRLEPFTRVDLLIYRGRNLDTITSAHIVTSFHEVRDDYLKLTSAAALVEVVEKITPDRESAIPVYDLLIQGLAAVAKGAGPTVVPAFLMKLLSISGYHPQLTVCAGCDRKADLGGFSSAIGGALCEGCWREASDGVGMPADQIDLMADLLKSDFGRPADPTSTIAITHVLKRYAEYHLERPLKSLALFVASP